MKLTKAELKQLIKEELKRVLKEKDGADRTEGDDPSFARPPDGVPNISEELKKLAIKGWSDCTIALISAPMDPTAQLNCAHLFTTLATHISEGRWNDAALIANSQLSAGQCIPQGSCTHTTTKIIELLKMIESPPSPIES